MAGQRKNMGAHKTGMAMNTGAVRKFADELMGKQVRYTAYYQRVCYQKENSIRWAYRWDTINLPGNGSVGWLTGLRWLQIGYRVPSSWDEQGHLKETAPRLMCTLVTPWPSHRPHRVPLDAFELLKEPERVSAWSDSERKLLRKIMPRIPRDERGRFIAGELLPKEEHGNT